VCLTGKRACPPEDCGDVWGYAGFLEAMHDPQHPEHENRMEWIGGEFDPDVFDLDKINTALQNLKEPRVRRR
jgi:pRiA4b ORF-3-like protein